MSAIEIVAGDERAIGEALVEHGVEAPGLAHVAIDRVRQLLRARSARKWWFCPAIGPRLPICQ